MPKPKHIHRSDFSAPINKNLISIQWLLDMPIYCHSNRNCPGGTGIVGWVRITHGPHSSVSINTPLFQKCTCTLDAQLKIIYVELGLTLWSVLSLEISCSAAQCLQEVLSFSFGAEQPSDESTQYPQGIQPCNSSVFYQKHRTYFKISCGGRHEVDDTLLLFSLLCLSSKERSVPPFQVWHLTGKQFSNMALETSIHNWGNSQMECLIWHL